MPGAAAQFRPEVMEESSVQPESGVLRAGICAGVVEDGKHRLRQPRLERVRRDDNLVISRVHVLLLADQAIELIRAPRTVQVAREYVAVFVTPRRLGRASRHTCARVLPLAALVHRATVSSVAA